MSNKHPWWQFALDVAGTWGGEIDALKHLRQINNVARTLDAVVDLSRGLKNRAHAVGGDAHAWAARNGIVRLGTSRNIDSMCFKYAKYAKSHSVYVAADNREMIRVSLPHNEFLYLLVTHKGFPRAIYDVFVHTDHVQAVQCAVADLVWQVEGVDGLHLIREGNEYSGHEISVMPLAGSGDYVLSNNGVETQLELLTHRTRKFAAAGYSRKVLLHGPPGTGKTTLAHKLADAIDGRLLQVSSKVNGSAHEMMEYLNMLRPNVMLLDDIDRNASSADLLLDMLSQTNDAVHSSIVVIGTVNAVGQLDPALLRPGRFDEVLNVDVPSVPYLRMIVQHYMRVFGVDGVPLERAVMDMTGFAPADVREVIMATGIVGIDVYAVEIARVRKQREYHSGDAVAAYLNRNAQQRQEVSCPTPSSHR